MGMVRKTLSVGTLGIVSFRSKKEKLRRAEHELAKEQRQREDAESRVAAAEKKLKHATASAAKRDKKLEKAQAKRRKRRAARLGELVSSAEPIVHQTAGAVRGAGAEGARRGRRAARQAQKRAQRAARSTKDVVGPRAETIAARVSDAVEELTNR